MKPIKLKMKDMDSVLEYTTENPAVIHHQTYKMLDWIYSKKKKPTTIELLVIELTDDEDLDEAILNVEDWEWETALKMGLKFFEEQEEYEMCSKVNKLLTTIKNN